MRQPAPTGQSMGYSCRSRQLCSAKALGQPRHRLRMRVERSAAASTGSATSHAAQQQEQQQAVVIGSGMAGLVAAEVLSRHLAMWWCLRGTSPTLNGSRVQLTWQRCDIQHSVISCKLLLLELPVALVNVVHQAVHTPHGTGL